MCLPPAHSKRGDAVAVICGRGGEAKEKDIKKLPVGPLKGKTKTSVVNYSQLKRLK